MSYQAEGVEVNTRKGRPRRLDHAANQDNLREKFRYLGADTRAMILNIIEANARHWYCEAGGSRANFEILFNNEIHAEQ